MCGIAGILGRVADRAVITRMLDEQRHRGPDGRGIWVSPEGHFTLGHDRLAIVDLAGGDQPLANEDQTLWLAVNGEIYNHEALRRELEGRHHFRTSSDSEAVLHLFEEEGPECVRRLDGMFAIALWGQDGRLFLARDPLGIKPLYYGCDANDNFRFSSEIGALVEQVAEVRELPPGHYMFAGQQPVQFYKVPAPAATMTDPDEAVALLDAALEQAVNKRLMADVPVGVFLSGGLDSSLIAAIMRKQVSGALHSFSVGVKGSADLLNARRVAADLGTIHHERVLAPREVLDVLPGVVTALESCDPALVRSAIPTYFVSELAARYVKVVLSGEGADELFAGYHYLSEFEPEPAALSQELHLTTRSLHNSNLQRVDRMTMAHGLEGRVPFLDQAIVALAFRIDPALKRRNGEGKWVLRKVAERYLPSTIVWRNKEKFASGTGVGPLLEQYANGLGRDGEDGACACAEEALYWSFFRDRYGRADVLAAMGRSRSLGEGQRWVSAL
ncbi:MAG: asparagine synthase [Firmicutes bacterium]|nr:asparagine synthase [Bacillota bacterium]